MKWWLKFLLICTAFGLGAWFGQSLGALHYEKILARERAQQASRIQAAVEDVLERIDIKFCAQWNVSVPPYDDSVAAILEEEDAGE